MPSVRFGYLAHLCSPECMNSFHKQGGEIGLQRLPMTLCEISSEPHDHCVEVQCVMDDLIHFDAI